MATKTYPQLTAATDVEGGDLLATWRSTGPLKRITAAIVKAYMQDGALLVNGTVPMTGALRSAVGSEGNPGLTFAGDTDTGFYWVGANEFAASVGGLRQGSWSSRGLALRASTTVGPGLSLPPGVAPTSPVDGDIWSTTSGLFARINGDTEQLAVLGAQTLTGKLTFVTPTTAEASANFPAGVAPTSPVDGDMWATAAGLFFRTGGVTLGPIGNVARLNRSARTSNTIIGVLDLGSFIDITSGTFTQTFSAAATLGAGFWCYLQNTGTGAITLDPNASETIDGLASFIVYPGETRLIMCDGSNLFTSVFTGFEFTATASGSFVWPPGYKSYDAELWGAGGGGGGGQKNTGTSANGGAGGGGGAKRWRTIYPSEITLGGSTAFTVGTGGAAGVGNINTATGTNGSAGGATSLGSILSANGGGGGNGGGIGTGAGKGGGWFASNGGSAETSGDSDADGPTLYGGSTGGIGDLGAPPVPGFGSGFAGAGGGGGARVNSSTAAAGAAGGKSNFTAPTGGGGAGGAIATNGGAGLLFGDAGGGGGSTVTINVAAGAGGAGNIAGGGGGGGASVQSPGATPSGNGGVGGSGYVVIKGVP